MTFDDFLRDHYADINNCNCPEEAMRLAWNMALRQEIISVNAVNDRAGDMAREAVGDCVNAIGELDT